MKRRNDTMPLNCVDKGMLALHTSNEFMVIHWVLPITGTLEPVRLRAALMAAVARYPALRATIRTGMLRQMRQIQDVSRHEPLTVSDFTEVDPETCRDSDPPGVLCQKRLLEWMNAPLDPTTDLPWRALLLRRSHMESSLAFTFHHSATDGIGALHFITEVIERYNRATDEWVLPLDQPCDITFDELVSLAQASRPGISHFYLKVIASLCHRFLISPFSPNGRICRDSCRPSPEVCFCQGTLNPYELKQIQSRCRASGVTVNDVLLAAGFRAIEQWNAVHGKPSRKISIMVPVDVARAAPSPPQCNRVSFISVSTRRHERANQEELLRTVHQRTSHMLRHGTAYSIVYAVYLCCIFPPVVAKSVARFLLATRVYLDSTLITNVGVIWPAGSTPTEAGRVGNARIASVAVMPPVVSPMGMSLSAVTYRDRLHVALTYKTSHFCRIDARLLLDLFLHEMRSYQRTTDGVLASSVTERATRESATARGPW